MRARRFLTVAGAGLLVVAMSGCSGGGAGHDTAEPLDGNFVGRVENTDALISVVVGERYAVAYMCDSEQIAQGFGGKVDGDGIHMSALQGNGTADLRIARGLATGTVTVNGVRQRFSAQPAPARAGFFYTIGTSKGIGFEARWVVSPNGDVRGAVVDRNTGDIIGIAGYDIELEADAGLPVRVVADSTTTVRQVVPGKRTDASSDTTVSVDTLATRYGSY